MPQYYDELMLLALRKGAQATTAIEGNTLSEEEIAKLKKQDGGDLVVFGSPTLAISLMELELIDEFQFTISPIMLGEGKTFLRNLTKKVNLELASSENMQGGVIGVHYRLIK